MVCSLFCPCDSLCTWVALVLYHALSLPTTQPSGNSIHYLQNLQVDILGVKQGHVCFDPDQSELVCIFLQLSFHSTHSVMVVCGWNSFSMEQ